MSAVKQWNTAVGETKVLILRLYTPEIFRIDMNFLNIEHLICIFHEISHIPFHTIHEGFQTYWVLLGINQNLSWKAGLRQKIDYTHKKRVDNS